MRKLAGRVPSSCAWGGTHLSSAPKPSAKGGAEKESLSICCIVIVAKAVSDLDPSVSPVTCVWSQGMHL